MKKKKEEGGMSNFTRTKERGGGVKMFQTRDFHI